MATVWAKNNGNWTDTTLWAFWNENTQQIEDYGQVPQEGDIVYCNGYVINVNTISVQISLHNDENPYTGAAGGHIGPYNNWTTQIISFKEFVVGNEVLIGANSSNTYYYNGTSFVGDVLLNGSGVFCTKSGSNMSFTYTISGNVICNSPLGHLVNDQSHNGGSLTINGNITTNVDTNDWLVRERGSLIVNGNLHWNGKITNNTQISNLFMVSGSLTLSNGATETNELQVYSELNIYNTYLFAKKATVQNVKYQSIRNCAGLLAGELIVPDTFTWKDITNPRDNVFVIITNAELNNRQQYPQESDVKNGVEYAYGLKEGNYAPNFPQESTVLKDVEYDDGNKVGTLEVIALSGATATAENISVVNLTEQEVERVKNCATVSTVQKCFEDFKE